MIIIENTAIYGWEAAIRGMRNPMNSWDKSDSNFHSWDYHSKVQSRIKCRIGPNDLDLMKRLAGAGNDHAKYLRMITVTVDITAPLYWWKEFDTYKVGTVANSCSTMHKIHAKEFTLDDFSHEHLIPLMKEVLEAIIVHLNTCRAPYLDTHDKKWWWQMIQLLPASYNQRRTVQLNYQVLHAMDSRKNHALDEWRSFIRWRDELPYYTFLFPEVTE